MVHVGVLGPVVVDGGAGVRLRPRERLVLGALVLGDGRGVPSDRLADALWPDDVPSTWPKQIQASIGLIRKGLGHDAVATLRDGYRLTLGPNDVDMCRFEQLVERGRALARSGEPDRAAATFDRALRLWRGRPFEGLEHWPPAVSEAARLEEVRRCVEEELLAARLEAGEHREVATNAEALVEAQPLREQRWAILAISQYRCGRQADALRTLQRARRTLVDELGIEPGRELVDLEHAILNQDPRLDARATAPIVSEACPYPGLVSYDVADQSRFFGREREVGQCVARLDQHGIVILTGASGQGKSSLARAGIAATLLASGRSVAVVTPGDDAPQSVLAAVHRLADAGGVGPALVVDQFEEVYAGVTDQAKVVCRMLDEQRRAGTAMVVVIRADHLTDLAADPYLGAFTECALHFVTALAGDALRAAIEDPAREAGLHVEQGLIDVLMTEVQDQPGALPLLSHALVETWRRRDGNVLTLEGYRASGGIRGAVARSADRVYDSLDPDQRDLLRSLLLRLVTPSAEGDVVRCRLDASMLRGDAEAQQLVDRLVQARLVTAEADSVELAHEALARAWPRLRGWLEEGTESQRVLRHLATTAAGWESLGRPDSELYRGARLETAIEHTQARDVRLTSTEAEFIVQSRAHEMRARDEIEARAQLDRRRARRLRIALTSTAVMLAVALVAGLVAIDRSRHADAARADAQLAALVNQSLALRDTNRAAAALLAVEAARRAPQDARARAALLGSFTAAPGFLGHQYLPDHERMGGEMLPGTNRAVVAIERRDLALLDLDTGERLVTFEIPDDGGWMLDLAVSRDARTVAVLRSTREEQAQTLVYDVGSGARVADPIELDLLPGRLAISPDGAKVAVAEAGSGAVAVLDVASGGRLGGAPSLGGGTDPRDRDVGAIGFAPNGDLVVGSAHGPLRVLDGSTLAVQASIDVPPQSASQFVHIGVDGRAVAVGHEAMVGFDVAGGRLLWTTDLRGTNPVPCIAFTANESTERVYCGNAYGVVEERDRTDGESTGLRLDPQLGLVASVTTSSDGAIVTTFGRAISRWSLSGDGLITDLVAPGYVTVDGYEPIAGERQFVGRRDLTVGATELLADVAIWDPAGDPAIQRIDINGSGAGWLGPDTTGVVDWEQPTPRGQWYDISEAAVVDGAVLPLSCDQFLVSAGGTRLYCAGAAGDVWAVDTATRQRIGPTIHAVGAVNTVSATRDGERVVVTAFGPDGPATTVHDGRTGELLAGPLHGPWRSAVSLSGHLLAATDGTLTRYDLATLEPLGDLPGARGEINLIQFSNDGRTVMAASNDQTVSLYDLPTGIRLGDPIAVESPFGYGGFLRPDAHQLAVTTRAGVVTWNLEPDALLDAACRLAGRNLTQTEWASYMSAFGTHRETCFTED